jgi:hypothetical protein
MNLNKYTKAELISKFKKLEAKNSSNNNSTNTNFVEVIISLKNWIMRLTIIALIIKYFKKYTFISKILRFFNWIILSIFGISLIDNFNLSFITNFATNIRLGLSLIMGYFTSTQFYSYLSAIWGLNLTKEPEIKSRTWSSSTVYPKSSFNEDRMRYEKGESERNSKKILKWLNDHEEFKKEESNNTKYYLLLLLLALGGTAWYFYGLSIDEISSFIRIIGDDKIYLLIPFFATSKSFSNAKLRLSEPFLVNNKSNPVLITRFILEQWESSGFNIYKGSLIYFSFKFKRVWIT